MVQCSSGTRNRRRLPMRDEFDVLCPYCGEPGAIYLEPDIRGTLVQDCEVCCNPWHVTVWWDDGERSVSVSRGDGSE
jgi:hypothetical protein